MMIRFRDVLDTKDREHVRRILNSSISVDKPGLQAVSKVNEFLRDDTYIADDAVEPFKEMTQPERERLISELIWRVTCHLDGSITRVLGVHAYPLGKKFSALQTEEDDRDIFCLGLAG
jgi:hypothetical protein